MFSKKIRRVLLAFYKIVSW